MNKRTYKKPTLVSQEIQLGVFGDYSDNGDRQGSGRSIAGPVDVVRKLDLHLE